MEVGHYRDRDRDRDRTHGRGRGRDRDRYREYYRDNDRRRSRKRQRNSDTSNFVDDASSKLPMRQRRSRSSRNYRRLRSYRRNRRERNYVRGYDRGRDRRGNQKDDYNYSGRREGRRRDSHHRYRRGKDDYDYDRVKSRRRKESYRTTSGNYSHHNHKHSRTKSPRREGSPSPKSSGSRNSRFSSSRSKSNSDSVSSHDDTIGEYKGTVGDSICDRYEIFNELGTGTFGRVLACIDSGDKSNEQAIVAVKVVRAVKKYTKSAKVESGFLELVNEKLKKEKQKNPETISYFIRLLDHFIWKDHYCIVTEVLGLSLYNVIKSNNYQGFCLKNVVTITEQILIALSFLENHCEMVHTDLKLENVLLKDDNEVVKILQGSKAKNVYGRIELANIRVKLIDFGGACRLEKDESPRKSIINTRQYRAPEVTLQTGWSYPSDIWSTGCISVELLLGDLLFQTHEELEHLALIEKITRERIPPDLVEWSPRRREFFHSSNGRLRWPENAVDKGSVKHVEQARTLKDLIMKDKSRESEDSLKDYLYILSRMLTIDPKLRLSASRAVSLFSRQKK